MGVNFVDPPCTNTTSVKLAGMNTFIRCFSNLKKITNRDTFVGIQNFRIRAY